MPNYIPKNKLGNTELEVTELGFGSASLGNLYTKVEDEEARNTLNTANELGINFYDTAPRYGLGLSERRVGDNLRKLKREQYVLSTKVGRILKAERTADIEKSRYGFLTPMPFDAHYDYTYDGIMRSYEDSLQRLGLASVDILLVHDIGFYEHGDKDNFYYDQLKKSGFKALEELRRTKQIKAIGLGVNETEICERAMELGQFDCFLLAGRYSLLEQNALDSFLPKCIEHGASVILGGPYNSGILASGVKHRQNPTYNYAPAPKHIIEKVSLIEDICEKYDLPIAAAALQFPLAHPAVATVIPGLGSEQRVRNTLKLYHQHIPKEFWLELKSKGVIKASAPLPCEASND